MNFFKNTLLFLLLGAAGAGLLLKSSECVGAARSALALCFETLIPTLFPFFVLSSLVVSCGGGTALGLVLRHFMRPLFGLSGAGGSALALGLLGGYPVGARTVGELYLRREISQEEAQQLLSFCNNAGPGFILGFCGAGVFQSTRTGAYLYLVHVASALLAGILLHRTPESISPPKRESTPPLSFFSAFPQAVTSSFAGIWNVCGFVILFMVLLRIVSFFPPLAALSGAPRACLFGFLELTNGIAAVPKTREGFIACAAILGWGGLSVHAQSLAVLEGTRLSTARYFLGKALQALVSIPLALLAAGRLF